jgi:hypothetical protein
VYAFPKWLVTTPLMESFVSWLTSTHLSKVCAAQAPWAWPLGETLHFVGLSLLMGSVGLYDLRLLGLMKRVPIGAVRSFVPWAITGFVLNLVTGIYFFVVQPRYYIANPAWWPKVFFLIVAGVNVAVFERTLSPRIIGIGEGEDTPISFKVAGAVSLASWFGVLYFGRMLAFLAIN